MKQTVLKVQGMSCGHCVNAIQAALKEAGVSGTVDLEAGIVTVEYNEGSVNPAEVIAAIEEQGYEAAILE
ncbi:cation transporter [Paenibacillus sp. JSM ZJ436]|uniref:cation transporter n=1 Tax=Paenibacillus sp. JSM ZJ436 TaxID=3376190 RepID=UPI00379533D0